MKALQSRLEELAPNLLLIGAMTLALPGAIQIARIAKAMYGDRILTVLGGWHVNETVYSKAGQVYHHSGSPMRGMLRGTVPRVFDLVLSGNGEEVVYWLGNIVGSLVDRRRPLTEFQSRVEDFRHARGSWIASWLGESGIQTIESEGRPLDYSALRSACELFGTEANFRLFECDKTVHTYSDVSCVHKCDFCSESNSLRLSPTPPSPSPRSTRRWRSAAWTT